MTKDFCWCSLHLWLFDPGSICIQIEQRAKWIMVFIENLKEIGLPFWLIWIAWWLFLISAIFRGKTVVKVGPKAQILGKFCLCKNPSFSKCFEPDLYNYENYLCPKNQRNLTFFSRGFAPKLFPSPKKKETGPNWVLNQKKRNCFFWVKLRTENTQKLKLGI